MSLDTLIGMLYFVLLGLPTLYLVLELLLGAKPPRARSKQEGQEIVRRRSAAILMPAHNEELIIGETLQKLLAQTQEDDRVIVVADNCDDRTVEICHEYGVEVLERTNLEQKGKGFALDFGFQHLTQNPPETLVILDADSEFLSGSLDLLVAKSQQLDRVVQSRYLMKAADGASIKTRLAEFAWLIKCQVRPLALRRLNIGCHLHGSGMAFPWSVLLEHSFASDSIVEDLELGLKLAQNSNKVYFEAQAQVLSYFPNSAIGMETQRTRWEHGHLASVFTELPQVMLSSLGKGNWRAFLLAFDAVIPPTISWLLVIILSSVIALCLSFLGLVNALYISTFTMLGMGASLFIAWIIVGRSVLSFNDLLQAPKYFLSKFSLYRKFIVGRETKWVRTDRK